MPCSATDAVTRPALLTAALALLLTASHTLAAPAPGDCTGIADDGERLACYDQAHGRPQAKRADRPAAAPQSTGPPAAPAFPGPAATSAATSAPAPPPDLASPPARNAGTGLSAVWDLETADKRGTFQLRPHRANYLLPLLWTDRPNRLPSSPAQGHSVETALPAKELESKFQVSAKVKILENLLGDTGDLWFAYTQQSNWQLYNSEQSSPFRETNYEPEAIFTLRTDAPILGWRWRLLNLGFSHQSNGRSLPFSRSWNRVYAQFGLERGNFTLMVRPWLRIPERDSSDDNPDIGRYLGSGDVRLVYSRGGHVLSALARYSFSGGRGSLQLDWAYPISGAFKGYLQLTRGYGESLIDYNHSQTTIGLGVLLLPWQ